MTSMLQEMMEERKCNGLRIENLVCAVTTAGVLRGPSSLL